MSDILYVVMPAYNEEESIEHVVENIITKYPQYDYVIINDGSRDKTLEVLREYNKKDPRVRYVSFSRNFGKE